MSADEPTTVGRTVADARRAAGLTVQQVADATRIRATLVSAIEQDDFRLCGGDVYARGHLKSIATAVGLDPQDVVAQFDHDRGRVVVPSAQPEPVAAPMSPARPERSSLGALAAPLGGNVEGRRSSSTNWSAVMALAVVVVLGIAVVSWLGNRGSTGTPVAQPTTSQSTGQQETPTAQPTQSAEPTSTPSPTDAVAEADGVVVKLAVTGKASWVRITGGPDKKTLFEGTLSKGQKKTFKDKDQINLLVGNAGAVTLTVNGRDLGEPGGSGQVVNLEFVPGDPTGQAG
jgi:cytoskeleton protein RodZ